MDVLGSSSDGHGNRAVAKNATIVACVGKARPADAVDRKSYDGVLFGSIKPRCR